MSFSVRSLAVGFCAAILYAACGTEKVTAVDGEGAGGIANAAGASAAGAGGIQTDAGGYSASAATGADAMGQGNSGGDSAVVDDGGDAEGVPIYTVVVDAPADYSTVSGVVTVSGRAPGFLNVEVWDATHQHPPLAQTTPNADGTFVMQVDTANLTQGPTTWTVYGWDSPPGTSFQHQDSVSLYLTIAGSDGGSVAPQSVGIGDINSPAIGPAPSEAANVGGAPFVLVKNWDFGTNGTIVDTNTLISEFQFHDQFNTIANGTNYGAVTVAPTQETAISGQPVEDPARPNRQWTADAMQAHVLPLSTSQTTVSASAHDAGCGSLTAKWTLPTGGVLLGRDILWETRARMPIPLAAYWFAIWTSGNQWNGGAEMDVLESFGTPNIYPPPTAFHVNSVGGTDAIDYSSWPSGLDAAGVPADARDLRQWHTWTWLYRADDSYVVYYDGYVVQTGSIHWTLGGAASGEVIDMNFLFDFGWGHTQVQDVNITLPASDFPVTYEIDYSRVYLR